MERRMRAGVMSPMPRPLRRPVRRAVPAPMRARAHEEPVGGHDGGDMRLGAHEVKLRYAPEQVQCGG